MSGSSVGADSANNTERQILRRDALGQLSADVNEEELSAVLFIELNGHIGFL